MLWCGKADRLPLPAVEGDLVYHIMLTRAGTATGPHVFIAGQTVQNADAPGMQSYTGQTKKVLQCCHHASYMSTWLPRIGACMWHHLSVHAFCGQVLSMLEAQLTAAGSSKHHMLKVGPVACRQCFV